MSNYLATITVPLVFDATDDDQARLRLEHISHVLAQTTLNLPHAAQVFDASSNVLQAIEPGGELRTVYTEAEFMARSRPVHTGAAGDCLVCQEYERGLNATF